MKLFTELLSIKDNFNALVRNYFFPEPISPLKLNITVNVIYATEIQENATSDFKKHINDQISGVPCFDSANCETDIDINQSIMTIGFSISTTEGQDLHYSDFISTGERKLTLFQISTSNVLCIYI